MSFSLDNKNLDIYGNDVYVDGRRANVRYEGDNNIELSYYDQVSNKYVTVTIDKSVPAFESLKAQKYASDKGKALINDFERRVAEYQDELTSLYSDSLSLSKRYSIASEKKQKAETGKYDLLRRLEITKASEITNSSDKKKYDEYEATISWGRKEKFFTECGLSNNTMKSLDLVSEINSYNNLAMLAKKQFGV